MLNTKELFQNYLNYCIKDNIVVSNLYKCLITKEVVASGLLHYKLINEKQFQDSAFIEYIYNEFSSCWLEIKDLL